MYRADARMMPIAHESFLVNQTNFNKTVPEKYKKQAKLAVKDEYTFDFLELTENHQDWYLPILFLV